ncbi:MAG: acetyl-CoA acetyltransferase [Gammaproteobacteria bacterium]|nr:acetyl-CoA acetyltransferase [Gammaproteobacteria bacterium]
MVEKSMPVLVGVGQVTEREFDVDSSSVLDLVEQAVYKAAADAGISKASLADLDSLVMVKSFRESTRNSPEALANRIGATRASQWLMPNGGNGPQYLVNRYSEAIANGESRFVLFAGAEAMATARKIVKTTGEQPSWQEAASGDPKFLVEDAELSTLHEQQHGLWLAPGFYAMSENARRHQLGHSVEEHQLGLGELFARFTEVAAKSPHAWYPVQRSAEEIATATDSNRYVAWPYTKYMNAMNQINQSAALLLTSVDHARKLGISDDKFIFLHGCSDTKEKSILGRQNYYSSEAMRVMAEQVFENTGPNGSLSIDNIEHIDFYSCFPSAVAMARDTFGLSVDDPRPLTITGGLPFHGGAGNNYVMNSIAAMVEKVRADKGSYGLVTANGGYFSKHAAGIYSTNPVEGDWGRTDPASYQRTLDDAPDTPSTESPNGDATIETYTVLYGRDNKPQQGVVIGRLGELGDPKAERFVAMVDDDSDVLEGMTQEDMIGSKGFVSRGDELNKFSLK